jgi:hypothetical protein
VLTFTRPLAANGGGRRQAGEGFVVNLTPVCWEPPAFLLVLCAQRPPASGPLDSYDSAQSRIEPTISICHFLVFNS